MFEKRSVRIILLVVCVPFLMSCMFVQNMFHKQEPKMESNADAMLQVLNGTNWVFLQTLAPERYTAADFAKPGTLTFTPVVTNDTPVYFSYGWCASDVQTLTQNLQHITVKLYLDGRELGSDVVHNISYGMTNGQVCSDFGVLMSDWPVGAYHLQAIATFDTTINDGMADYQPGDYIFEYNAKVNP